MTLVLGLAVLGLSAAQWRSSRAQSETQAKLEELAALARDGRASGPTEAFAHALGAGVSARDLRAMLREELRGLAGPPASHEEAEAAPATPDKIASEASQAAFGRAQTLVSQSIGARRWAEKDVDDFRRLKSNLTADQLDTVMRQLLPAINDQTVRVESEGPMF